MVAAEAQADAQSQGVGVGQNVEGDPSFHHRAASLAQGDSRLDGALGPKVHVGLVDPEDDLLILKLQADVRGPVGGGDEDQAALEEPVRLEGEAEVLTVDAGAEAVLYEGAVLEVVSRGDSDGARGGLGPLPRADGAVDVGRVAEGRGWG